MRSILQMRCQVVRAIKSITIKERTSEEIISQGILRLREECQVSSEVITHCKRVESPGCDITGCIFYYSV